MAWVDGPSSHLQAAGAYEASNRAEDMLP